ncbi:MAG: ABC transporter permease [Planctomycetales bacterium]|nr:ABC transporter permease [Planctomycetales bacterium]
MTQPARYGKQLTRLASDYGMVLVLLFLATVCSALTYKEQHPRGADAGYQVARQIAKHLGADASVLIVTTKTDEDRAFAAAAEEELRERGLQVLANVGGAPSDARLAIEQALAAGAAIDAIAANNVTARWTVYDQFPTVGSDKCFVPASYYWPDFLKTSNLLNIANQSSIYAIIAIGMTMVIITSGIDLSVGSLIALASVVAALFVRDFGGGAEASVGIVVVGCLAGIVCGAGTGAFHGLMVTRYRVPAFIVTLSMMMMARGAALRISNGQSINALPDSFGWLGEKETLGIPNPVLLMALLYLVAHVVMSRTVFGRYVYAIGGNEEAARLSGVPVKRMLLAVYTLCGALAGLGGIVLSSRLKAGDPNFGYSYELEVISAVVVGGTSIMGGQGRMFGTLIGAFIIAVIKNGMNLTNVNPFNQMIVLGAVLLASVLIDTRKKRDQ